MRRRNELLIFLVLLGFALSWFIFMVTTEVIEKPNIPDRILFTANGEYLIVIQGDKHLVFKIPTDSVGVSTIEEFDLGW